MNKKEIAFMAILIALIRLVAAAFSTGLTRIGAIILSTETIVEVLIAATIIYLFQNLKGGEKK